jgi:hypothetical protein
MIKFTTSLLILIGTFLPLHSQTFIDVLQNTQDYIQNTSNISTLLQPSLTVITGIPNVVHPEIRWNRLSLVIEKYNEADDTLTYITPLPAGITLESSTTQSVGAYVTRTDTFAASAYAGSTAKWQTLIRSFRYTVGGWPKPDIRPRKFTITLHDNKEPTILYNTSNSHYYYTPNPLATAPHVPTLAQARTNASNQEFLGMQAYLITLTTIAERNFVISSYNMSFGNGPPWIWLNTNGIQSGNAIDHLWDSSAPPGEANQVIASNLWADNEPNNSGNRIYFPYNSGFDDTTEAGLLSSHNPTIAISEFGGLTGESFPILRESYDANPVINNAISVISRSHTFYLVPKITNPISHGTVH